MIKDIPFAGVECDDKLNQCKVWWLSTVNNKTHQVELRIPTIIPKGRKNNAELDLENMMCNSFIDVL